MSLRPWLDRVDFDLLTSVLSELDWSAFSGCFLYGISGFDIAVCVLYILAWFCFVGLALLFWQFGFMCFGVMLCDLASLGINVNDLARDCARMRGRL